MAFLAAILPALASIGGAAGAGAAGAGAAAAGAAGGLGSIAAGLGSTGGAIAKGISALGSAAKGIGDAGIASAGAPASGGGGRAPMPSDVFSTGDRGTLASLAGSSSAPPYERPPIYRNRDNIGPTWNPGQMNGGDDNTLERLLRQLAAGR